MRGSDNLQEHFRLSRTQQRALHALQIETITDLVFHFPARYENVSRACKVSQLISGETVTVYGQLDNLDTKKARKRRTPMAEGTLSDETGSVKVLWFNQPYMAKRYSNETLVKASGRVSGSADSPYLSNPELEVIDEIPEGIGDTLWSDGEYRHETIYPIYPERQGITSRWFYHAVQRVIAAGVHETLPDPIPTEVAQRYHLPSRTTALVWLHAPRSDADAETAQKRFAFEEVFLIQIVKQQERERLATRQSIPIAIDRDGLQEFIGRFGFSLTGAQERAIEEILHDFQEQHAMSRLLEGDVGSGKTAVAASTAYAVATTEPYGSTPESTFGHLQVGYMAPTEILARQHFESFIEFFRHLPVPIGLITSSECRLFPSKVHPDQSTKISRTQLLKWVANGEIPILIGTHSLIQQRVQFENLAYVIIDEQHRFGTRQRQRLVRKDEVVPHLLSMTATPIPRTLALTIYGDLDITLLDEMPEGRKPVETDIVTDIEQDRERVFSHCRSQLEAGKQVYIICPLIEKSVDEDEELTPQKAQMLQAKAVDEEAARLQRDAFPEYDVGILHGKLSAKDKDSVMQQFLDGDIQVLVATSVVEVGVNVPNATTIVIENAERFGLAQLHQLRGRVLRSSHQAYCFAVAGSQSQKALDRLNALKSARTGFELAEYDLKLRGAGELYGRKQWGVSDVGMEAMQNMKMVEAAREEAKQLIAADPELDRHPVIAGMAEETRERIHFE